MQQVHFTAVCTGGIPLHAGFPPLGQEEIWNLELYRRIYRRNSCKCRFSASHAGGKPADAFTTFCMGGMVANSVFPPLGHEESLQMGF